MANQAQPSYDNQKTDVKDIDLNLFTVFDVVMTERHVTRAAERMGTTQSAVSNALNRLRSHFEDQLFTKASRGVTPTPKALSMWPVIHEALSELRASVHPKSFDALASTQCFRIAMADITAAMVSADLHKLVHSSAPNVRLFFVPHDPALLTTRLMRGEIDFALSIEQPRSSVIVTMPLWKDSFTLAGRKNHPLLRTRLSLRKFCDAPQIAVNEAGDDEALNMIDESLTTLGVRRNIVLSVNQFSIVPRIIRNTDLLAVIPTRFAKAPGSLELFTTQDVPLAIPDVTIYLSWHRRTESLPSHQWLKDIIIKTSETIST
jgi:DNA-binding transcriptional LysR family regulator